MNATTMDRATLRRTARAGRTNAERDRLTRTRVAAARQVWADFRAAHGFARLAAPILSPPNANTKLAKNAVPSYSIALAPAALGSCPYSTPNCRHACVAHNGHGGRHVVGLARWVKLRFWREYPALFRLIVESELRAAVRKHGAIACRLNAFSDIPWERHAPEWFAIDGVQFYDYTKWPTELRGADPMPNYHLVRSMTEHHTPADVRRWVTDGHAVAVVVDAPTQKHPEMVPPTWHDMPTVNGDAHDDRSRDRGVIVVLGAKGRMRGLPMAQPLAG